MTSNQSRNPYQKTKKTTSFKKQQTELYSNDQLFQQKQQLSITFVAKGNNMSNKLASTDSSSRKTTNESQTY